MIDVACGIIRLNTGEYLISQRSINKKEYALFWELPGGKCERNENIENCLIRELKEELNITVEFDEIIYKKEFLNKYNLYYCTCTCVSDIKNIKINYEIEKYAIVKKENLLTYNFINGDKEILINNFSKI